VNHFLGTGTKLFGLFFDILVVVLEKLAFTTFLRTLNKRFILILRSSIIFVLTLMRELILVIRILIRVLLLRGIRRLVKMTMLVLIGLLMLDSMLFLGLLTLTGINREFTYSLTENLAIKLNK